MRDTKFRMWDSVSKKYYYDGFIIYPSGEVEFPAGGWDLLGYVEKDAVLQQYTGVDDKNGTPIYEGDIVEGTCLGFCDDDEFKDVVEYGNGSFCFSKEKWKDGTYDWYSLENYDSEGLLVVGNIYENPELL